MIRLAYDNALQRGDLVRTDGLNLETDEGLETAVVVSLMSDARADVSNEVDSNSDQRGWWGEAFLDGPLSGFGSRLWLLKREKLTEATLLQASTYVKEALQWMIDSRIALSVSVNTSRMSGRNDVGLASISIQRPRKSAPRFEHLWEVQFGL